MKKYFFSTVLFTMLFTLISQTTASAGIIYIKLGKGDLCVSWGSDAGACQKGIFLGSNDGDVDILVNGKPVQANVFRLTVDRDGKTASLRAESNSKSAARTAAPQVSLEQKSVNLSSILLKNKKTGEVISLATYLDIMGQCKN